MKLKATANCIVDGKPRKRGEVFEVSEIEGKVALTSGRVIRVPVEIVAKKAKKAKKKAAAEK